MMPQQVEGFVICDGRFFEDAQEAEYEEALYVLCTTFESSIFSSMPTVMLTGFLENYPKEVMRFCEAILKTKHEELPETPMIISMDELNAMTIGKTYETKEKKNDKDQGQDASEAKASKKAD